MPTDARLAVARDVLTRHDHDVTGDPQEDRVYFARGELLGALRGLVAYAEEVATMPADDVDNEEAANVADVYDPRRGERREL